MLLLIAVILGFVIFSILNPKISARDILTFLLSSSISLFVLTMIVGILAGMGQGTTIVVSLFWDSANLLITIFAIHFLALILSHFPEYFMVGLSDIKRKYVWHKSKRGIVYYGINKGYKATEEEKEGEKSHVYLSFFRREIGILTYALWIFILLTVYKQLYGCYDINVISIIGFAILAYFHLILERLKKKIDRNKDLGEDERFIHAKKYLRLFQLFFWLHIFLVVITCVHIARHNISEGNLLFLIITTYQGAFLYVIFRVFRGWFKYFEKTNKSQSYVSSILPFQHFAYTVKYLSLMRFFGMFFAIVLLFHLINPKLNINNLNPVPVFIIILILYYSAFVITIKKYLYHNKKHAKEKKANINVGWTHNRKMAIIAGITPILFLIYTSLGNIIDNDLHTLQMVDEKNVIDVDQFIDNLPIDSSLKSHFIIGAYGGGLKANAWTLLTLRELEKKLGRAFIESTLCMSGVSGGALGLGNYTMISRLNAPTETEIWNKTIEDIGKANVLSSDLGGWLINDLLRDPLPFKFKGRDRANESMENYQNIIGDTLAGDQSFKEYWSDTYRENNSKFPAILINTTPTSSKYGLACSVDKMTKFPIMADILSHADNQSPTFLAAVSTSNRFPLFSPAARIKNKGHFVDGGYFDNSGLLNARSFYKQLESKNLFKTKKREKVVAVNIMNDRLNYILSKKEIRAEMKKLPTQETSSGEIKSIIGGIAALERMPNFVREKIEADSTMELVKIQMPHRFTVKHIELAYGTTGLKESQFKSIIEDNEILIKEALEAYGYDKDWGIVEPPLGRLLSQPAVEYEAAMLAYHPEIQKSIATLNKYLYGE